MPTILALLLSFLLISCRSPSIPDLPPDLLCNLAERETLEGHPKEALRYLEQAWQRMNASEIYRENRALQAEIQLNLARAHRAIGHRAKSETAFRLAHELDPGNRTIMFELGLFLYEDVQDYSSARRIFERLLDKNPHDAEALYYRGQIAFNEKEPRQALADFNSAIRLGHKDYQIYYWRAQVRHYLGQLRLAEEDYLRSIELNPTAAHPLEGMISTLVQLGDIGSAIRYQRHLLRLSLFSRYHQLGLSVLYLMNGDLLLGITRFLFWWGVASAAFIALYVAILLPGASDGPLPEGADNVPLLVYQSRWICFLIAFWFLISFGGNSYLIHLFWKIPFDSFGHSAAALEFDYVIFPVFLAATLLYRYLHDGKALPRLSPATLNLNFYWGLKGLLYTIVFALGGGYLIIRLLDLLSIHLVIEEKTYTPFFASARSLKDYLLAIFSAALLAPVCEETFFRGVIFPGVKARHGEVKAIVVTALFFATFHLTIDGFPVLFHFGIVLTYLYNKTGSLLAPIITHSLYNLMLLASVYLNTPKGAP